VCHSIRRGLQDIIGGVSNELIADIDFLVLPGVAKLVEHEASGIRCGVCRLARMLLSMDTPGLVLSTFGSQPTRNVITAAI
jgi:hypothetical protein